MSMIGITQADFDFSLQFQTRKTGQSSLSGVEQAEGAGLVSFLSSLRLRLAEMQSQTFDALMTSGTGTAESKRSPLFASFSGVPGESANPLDFLTSDGSSAATGFSAMGRNSTLFDPESAYRMMSVINSKDVTYKAQYSELSEMKSYLAGMQQEAQSLGRLDAATDNEIIRSRLEGFAGQYNEWIRRFDGDLQAGGLLAGTQAAQIAQWELEQSVENLFNGARDGLHGMRDLGFTLHAVTNLAELDVARLESVLGGNKPGAIATLQEFGADMAKAVELLNSNGNFLHNQLGNLDRAIDYIGDNKVALQAEFGLGDATRPTGQIAKALASYEQIYAMSG